MNRKEIIKTFLVVWFVGATVYIISDIWNNYKEKGIQAAYRQGADEIINKIFNQAKESRCTSFEIYDGDNKLKLVNAQCFPDSIPAENPDGDAKTQ